MKAASKFRATALAYAALYALCAIVALFLTQGEDGITAFWPASGVFIAGLLLVAPKSRRLLIGGVAVASFGANTAFGVGPLAALGYTIANVVEGLLVIWLMGERRRSSFVVPRTIVRFFGAAVVGGSASALMAGVLSLNLDPDFLLSWASTVILGMITVTPTLMFLMKDREGRRRLLSLRGVGIVLMTGALSVAAFGQTAYPLLFLPMVGLAFATLMSGVNGAGKGLLVVAGVGSYFTAVGEGPISLAFDSVQERVVFLQAYLFSLVAAVLPLAVVLVRHESEAKRNLKLAETDTLTGLATRRKILADLNAAMAKAREDGSPLSVAMVDIDHFKPINDRFGHERGDEILTTLTMMMRAHLGREAKVGRLGGEEFLAIFEAPAHDVMEPSEDLRRRAETYRWPIGGPEQVTLSVGIAQFEESHHEPAHLLRDADLALYEAKENGRNRTRIRQKKAA